MAAPRQAPAGRRRKCRAGQGRSEIGPVSGYMCGLTRGAAFAVGSNILMSAKTAKVLLKLGGFRILENVIGDGEETRTTIDTPDRPSTACALGDGGVPSPLDIGVQGTAIMA